MHKTLYSIYRWASAPLPMPRMPIIISISIIVILIIYVNVNVNVNKQYLSTRKSCNKSYDGCTMRVVFSKPQNCPGSV